MARPIRIVMAGITGKTGSEVARALVGEDDLELVGAVARGAAGQDAGQALGVGPLGVRVSETLREALDRSQADVLVDFTHPSVAGHHALLAVERGVRPVVGTTGIPADLLAELEEACARRGLGACVIPNFSFGVMLLLRFVAQAAEIYPRVEIVEKHHHTKVDAPSGTALRLARRLQEAGTGQVPIHSVRLPGHVAHHEVIFGGTGEVLTLKHDTISRASFGPGVILAVRRVLSLDRVVYDLGELL